ncbi:hypothetical protein BV22DRAFT_1197936 [Leucogyrophana mollusca]|uniref:Uncharacterized protein n=1 Tax=Leucogyrophana mollusca TaxID=85980 RepID=A0ACB8B909_9AGAM|nr:hypothetical protein BV22DRAFT_1197936 [Leucogyrophana mollusca]
MDHKGIPVLTPSTSESLLHIDLSPVSTSTTAHGHRVKTQQSMPNVNPHLSPSGPFMIPARSVVLPASLHLNGSPRSSGTQPTPDPSSSRRKITKSRKLSQVFSDLPRILHWEGSPTETGQLDGTDSWQAAGLSPQPQPNSSSQRNRLVRTTSRRKSLLPPPPQPSSSAGLHPIKALTSPRPSLSAAEIPTRRPVTSPPSPRPIAEANESDDPGLDDVIPGQLTPEQRQRARLAKLTRHLGENIPPELVSCPARSSRTLPKDGLVSRHQRRSSLDLATLLSAEPEGSPFSRHPSGLKRSRSLWANNIASGDTGVAEPKEVFKSIAELPPLAAENSDSETHSTAKGEVKTPSTRRQSVRDQASPLDPSVNTEMSGGKDGIQSTLVPDPAESRWTTSEAPPPNCPATTGSNPLSPEAPLTAEERTYDDASRSASIPIPIAIPSTRPSTSTPSPRPSTSIPSPRPSTSVPSPRPSTSISSPRPSTSIPPSCPSSSSLSNTSTTRRHRPQGSTGSLPRRPATADSAGESLAARQRRAAKLANFFGVEYQDISTATFVNTDSRRLEYTSLRAAGEIEGASHSSVAQSLATPPLPAQPRLEVDVQVTKPTRFWKFMDGKNTLKNVNADDVMKQLRTMKASM